MKSERFVTFNETGSVSVDTVRYLRTPEGKAMLAKLEGSFDRLFPLTAKALDDIQHAPKGEVS